MNNSLGKYFIAVLPDKNTVRMVNNLRDRYKGIIELPKSPVHITLKESFFTSNIDGLIARLEQTYKNVGSFNLALNGYDVFSGEHIVLKVKKNPDLYSIHKNAIQLSQEFVEDVKPYIPKEKLSPTQKQLLKKYNNPYCLRYYNPHMTVGSITDSSELVQIRAYLDGLSFNSAFRVSSVAIIDKLKHEVYHQIKLK